MKMNIALAANEHFAIPCLVTIISLLENNKQNDCCIYVLTTGFSKKTSDKFNKLSQYYKQQITIITKVPSQLDGVAINPVFSVMTYFRFFLPEILSAEKKVLYLDSDMIVLDSLKELYNTDISGKACAVVEDQWADDICAKNRLKIEGSTFNAGMLVMNLDYWRDHSIPQKCIDYLIQNNKTCIYCDQDAMNALLEKQVIYVPYRYNIQTQWFSDLNKVPFHFSKWNLLKDEMIKPVIMHYSTPIKPWHKESTHPYKDKYLYYAKLHSFIGFTETSFYSIKLKLALKILFIYNKITKKNITLS